MHAPSTNSTSGSSFRFSFEELRAYREARAGLALVVAERERTRGAPGELRAQLERALVSVCLNLAEGAGRKSATDQARLYQIAFGSLAEAMAALQLVQTLGDASSGLAAAEQRLRSAGGLTLALIRATSR